MKIYIMRHGEAQQFAPSDAQRALTDRGRHESEAVARACVNQRGVKGFDLVLVSPYYGLNRRGNCSRIIFPPKEWKLAMASRPTASRIEYLITYRP